MEDNSVSVVIPCYNASRFIAESIGSALAQDYRPLTVTVVDDGSTDGTLRCLKAFDGQIQLIQLPHSGQAEARNRGIRESKSQFIAFLDADDLWPAHKLHSQVAFLRAHPDTDIVLGKVRRFHSGEATEAAGLHGPYLGSALIRRAVFEQMGYLDPALGFAEDVDWFLRALESGFKLSLMNEDGLFYRQHDANLTRNETEARASLAQALHHSIKRRLQKRLLVNRSEI